MLIEALQAVQDPKRARILEGAMKVFLAYGYSRVTMDDIARAAEVSRPALYLVFKNKAEIYRALGTLVLDASSDAAAKVLAGDAPFTERAMAAIECSLIALMKPVLESPHGAELLDMKNTLAGDLAAMWRERLGKAFADAIAAEALRSGVDLAARGLSPAALADLLLDGLEGMKSRITNPEQQREGARRLVTVIGLALRA
jgi:AcrR family transcriptional regulator